MKKLTLIMAVFILAFGLFCTTAQAANNNIKVTVDGKQITFTDAKPFVDKNNRTQVPMRALGEALGCNVDYKNEGNGYHYVYLSQTGKNGMKWTAVCLANDYILDVYVDDDLWWNSISMDTDVVYKNGRTFLPARYIAEEFGYNVGFDSKTNTVIITTNPNSYINLYAYTDFDLSDFDGLECKYKTFNNDIYKEETGKFKFSSITDKSIKFSIDGYNESYTVKGVNKQKGKILFSYYHNQFQDTIYGALLLFNIDDEHYIPVLVPPNSHYGGNYALYSAK